MRKKGFALWIAILLLFSCTACGQQETQGEYEQTQAQDSLMYGDSEGSEQPAVPTVATVVSDRKETECVTGIVQVQTDNQRGSGVLWDKQSEHWYFVTAAHVVEGLEQAEVYFAEFDRICVANVYCIEGLDLAFLEIDAGLLTEEMKGSYEECMVVEEPVKSGDVISAIGYNASLEMLEYTGTVWEPWIYTEDFANYMLMCQCEAQAGMSGGAVFTANGALAGIVCGQNEEGMLAVLPAAVMEGEYNLFIDY